MTSGSAVRPAWDQLPAPLRDGLTHRLGEINNVDVHTGGFTPGLAFGLLLDDGDRVFVKGISSGHPLAGRYLMEACGSSALPAEVPAPRLRWSADIAGWVVLVFDYIEARHVDLSPTSPDVPRTVATVASLAPLLTPCPVPDAPDAVPILADLVHGWRTLAAAPPPDLDAWAVRHLDQLADLETGWLTDAAGDTMLHADINPSNLLITPDEHVYIVDWAQSLARGARWLDVADLVPHLIAAGHSPDAAEGAVADALAAAGAPGDAVTSYAVAFAGYWNRVSREPAPPGVPNLRGHQARCGRACLEWVKHRARCS